MQGPNTYSSLTNHYETNMIERMKKIKPQIEDEEWIATEKIHGANFSFFVDSTDQMICCKRSGPIKSNENFYSHGSLLEKYGENIKKMVSEIKQDTKAESVQVFGELFGGYYPGCESKSKPVQKGVYYCPENEFMVFDICIFLTIDEEFRKLYLDQDRVLDLCAKFNVPVCKPLHRGSLEKLLKLDPVFESTIYKEFNLDRVEDNIAEGYVFKPNKNIPTHIGRAVIKYKNDKFSEKISRNIKLEAKEEDPDIEKWVKELATYVNKNRFDAVVSKLSEEDRMNINKMIGLVTKDSIDELVRENDELGEKDKKFIKTLGGKARSIFAKEIIKWAREQDI